MNAHVGGIVPDQAEALVREHYDMVRRYASSINAFGEGSDDLVQQVFLVALSKLSANPPSGPMGAWLRGIARNLILPSRRPVFQISPAQQERILTAADEVFEDRFDRQALDQCLARLGADERELLRLRYFEELRSAEIARRLSRSRNWVCVRLHRIRAKLRECLEDQGGF